jgi:branched-chain amino acid transport system substrate-binding protein
MHLNRIVPVALTAGLLAFAVGCGESAGGSAGGSSANAVAKGEPLRIGLLLDLTGAAAPFGLPERDASKAIVDKINKDGGVGGRQIELATYDSSTSPTECARGATTLIREKRVTAILGGTTGSCTLAAAPVAAREKVPMLAPNGTIEITDKGKDFHPFVFRTATNDLLNTKEVFDQATAGGAKRVGVFFQEDAYGQNTADYIDELAKKRGVNVVQKASAALTATDLTAQASRLRNANPEVVLMQVSSPKVGAAFVRAADQVGLKSQLWGGIGLAQRSFVQAAGPAGNGVKLLAFGNPYEPASQTQELLPLLPKPQLEGFAELLATNGIMAVVHAAKKVDGDLDGQKLRDALASLCGVTTYSAGELCYSKSQDGWGAGSLVKTVIQGGKLKTEQ